MLEYIGQDDFFPSWLDVHVMYSYICTFKLVTSLDYTFIFKTYLYPHTSNLVEVTRLTTEHFSGIHLVAVWIKQINSLSLSVKAIISTWVHRIQRPIFFPLYYATSQMN